MCKELHPLTMFGKKTSTRDGLTSECKNCTRIRNKEIFRKFREKNPRVNRPSGIKVEDFSNKTEYLKQYRHVYRKELSENRKQDYIEARREGIIHYGGNCQCCGESIDEFLTLEHKDGRDKSKKRKTGKAAWLQAKWDRWPENLTVLCFNCNCGKGIYGKCPHEIHRNKITCEKYESN